MSVQFNPPAAPSITSTGRLVSQIIPQRVVPEVDNKILFKRANAAPVIAFSKGVRGRRVTDNRTFGWLFKDEYPRFSSVADASIADNGTTLNVPAGEGSRFYKNATVMNVLTREVFRVASVATDQL